MLSDRKVGSTESSAGSDAESRTQSKTDPEQHRQRGRLTEGICCRLLQMICETQTSAMDYRLSTAAFRLFAGKKVKTVYTKLYTVNSTAPFEWPDKVLK